MGNAWAQGAPHGGDLLSMLPMLLIFGAFFVFIILNQRKRQKEQKALLAGLAKDDEVITAGGIAGRIHAIEESWLTLEVAPKILIRVQRAAVTQVLPRGTLKLSPS